MFTKFKNYPLKGIGSQVTEKILTQFEESLPKILPDDYREFLKQYNGGLMGEMNHAFYIQGIPEFTETQSGEECYLDSFDSIKFDESEGVGDLLSQYKFYRNEKVFPEYFFPIGSDVGGGLVILSLGDTDYGHIYYWDHEEGWDEAGSLEPDYSHCYFVAKSFTEFIDSLRCST